MAKYEKFLRGNFDTVLRLCENAVLSKSASASIEGSSDVEVQGSRVAVRVYERYSMLGGNRASLSFTLVGHGDELFLVAIASGGSQAVFFKINTFGEASFLETLSSAVEDYARNGPRP